MEYLKKQLENSIWWGRGVRLFMLAVYTVFFCFLCFSDILSFPEYATNDNLVQRGSTPSEDVILIGIDSFDVNSFGGDAELLAARVVELLNAGEDETKPAAIGLDFPMDNLSAEALERLIFCARATDNLVLPVELRFSDPPRSMNTALSSGSVMAISATEPPLELKMFCSVGHTGKLEDSGGILRHAIFRVTTETRSAYSSLPTICVQKYCTANGRDISLPGKNDRSKTVIKFCDPQKSFPHYSARQVLDQSVSASSFAGKIVIIGYSDSVLDTGYYTAIDYSKKMHSAEIDANIVNAILTESFAQVVPTSIQILLLVLGVVGIAACCFRSSFFAGVGICALYELFVCIVTMLLYGVGYYNFALPHLLNAPITGIASAMVAYTVRVRATRANLERVLGQYVDRNIAKSIISDADAIPGGDNLLRENIAQGKTEKIAVLFADIRNFTAMSEKMAPKNLVSMLNEYLSVMSECITRHGGTVDKYIGDSVMAYWGFPTADSDAVYHACLAAAEIQRRSKDISAQMRSMVGNDIEIGIGINYGDAIIGNIGSADRMNYTAIADTVNTASRLEAVAPGGEIYLSESAMRKLDERAELERLREDVRLKGKEKAMPVYALKSISAQSSRKINPTELQRGSDRCRRRMFAAALMNLAIFVSQFLFVMNSVRMMGVDFLAYFPVSLSVVSAIGFLMLIPYDNRAAIQADGVNLRPRWLDSLLLCALMANLQIALTALLPLFPSTGLTAFSGDIWSGGVLIYVICPLLALVSFFVLENSASYRIADIALAELPIAVLLVVCASLGRMIGLDDRRPELFGIWYPLPRMVLTIVVELLLMYVLQLVNNKLCLQNRLLEKESASMAGMPKDVSASRLFGGVKNEREKQMLFLVFNLAIAVFSLRSTLIGYQKGGIEIYSNPSLVGLIVGVASIVLAVYNIRYILSRKTPGEWENYLLFLRALGCTINFSMIVLLVLSGESLRAFIEPRYNGDGTVFLLCPLLAYITFLSGKKDYKIVRCMLMAIPYMSIMILSKAAIYNRGLDVEYANELMNFYDSRIMAGMLGGELMMAVSIYYIRRFYTMALSAADQRRQDIVIGVCGSRNAVQTPDSDESEFGSHSSCYVLRDGNYAIVFDGGSGLSNAKKWLSGCKDVDIVLSSTQFSSLMGFLMVPNVCPQANIRIFSPFPASAFSAKPFWPVNIIRGEWITLKPGKKYKLTNSYNAQFIPSQKDHSSYIVSISGTVKLCYCAHITADDAELKSEAAEADYLIFGRADDWRNACYLAIDENISGLLVSGYSASMNDRQISDMEYKARQIFPEVQFARQGDALTVFGGEGEKLFSEEEQTRPKLRPLM